MTDSRVNFDVDSESAFKPVIGDEPRKLYGF